jgi:CBS-domain-containing membrane protein
MGRLAMSCAAIMSKNSTSVRADETIEQAARKLIAHQFISLPVIDADNRYFGMFGIYDLFSMLVPRVALAGNLLPNLRFISDNPDDLRSRYREVKARLVSEAADRNAVTLKPDMPEIEAIRLFCQSHSSLAVIDPQSRKVLGTISCWDAIRAIVGAQ